MKTKDLEVLTAEFFGIRKNLIVPNVYWGFGLRYEADLVVVTRSRYAYEVELKVTKSDLKAEAKKAKHAHNSPKFKRLYYSMPEKIFDPELVPERAGIILASDYRGKTRLELHRKPKDVKADPITESEYLKLLELCAMRLWGMKKKGIKW